MNLIRFLYKLRGRLTNYTFHQNDARLTADEWNRILISSDQEKLIVSHARNGIISSWGRELLNATKPGMAVLEIGSGSGEISLYLAKEGRKVTLLDLSLQNLTFSRQCAKDLGISVTTVEADALLGLPFLDESFDWVWSSGLLEHFSFQERKNILHEQCRITRKGVITLVPNAACVAYRAGKDYQEERGFWLYGLETPILTLREEYEAAGLRVDSEYSVGFQHAFNFLPNHTNYVED
jgi:SAM-dependent methyltransferase